jgi:ABC-type transport system involved in multi-copper enzyme maturation permease subunit
MYRTLVIARHTFFESIVQPIYSLLLAIGAAVLAIFAVLPFFTLGEDAVMYKAVSLDVILLPVLIATLFATSKSIYEEIEDRTMLTLMSKPIRRWEVLVGKYFGIIAAAAVAVAVLGLILALCLWFRVPMDYALNTRTVDEFEIKQISDYRWMHLAGAAPALVGLWLQVAVLAAISVALSTRFSLVVNLPTVILIYIAGNLTRFIDPAVADRGPIARGVAWVIKTVLPYLQVFDLREKGVYATIALPGSIFANDRAAVTLGSIWGDAGLSFVYAAFYATAALAVGLLLFQTRELGGAEG